MLAAQHRNARIAGRAARNRRELLHLFVEHLLILRLAPQPPDDHVIKIRPSDGRRAKRDRQHEHLENPGRDSGCAAERCFPGA